MPAFKINLFKRWWKLANKAAALSIDPADEDDGRYKLDRQNHVWLRPVHTVGIG